MTGTDTGRFTDLYTLLNRCDSIETLVVEAREICEPYSGSITGIRHPQLADRALDAALDLITHYAMSHMDALWVLARKRGVIDGAVSEDTARKPTHLDPAPSRPKRAADSPKPQEAP